MEDNQGEIYIAKNPVEHSRTKHIDVRYHYIQEAINEKIIELKYYPTCPMIADILTKPLPKGRFEILHGKMGLEKVTCLHLINLVGVLKCALTLLHHILYLLHHIILVKYICISS